MILFVILGMCISIPIGSHSQCLLLSQLVFQQYDSGAIIIDAQL
jgi:hypothetical protein